MSPVIPEGKYSTYYDKLLNGFKRGQFGAVEVVKWALLKRGEFYVYRQRFVPIKSFKSAVYRIRYKINWFWSSVSVGEHRRPICGTYILRKDERGKSFSAIFYSQISDEARKQPIRYAYKKGKGKVCIMAEEHTGCGLLPETRTANGIPFEDLKEVQEACKAMDQENRPSWSKLVEQTISKYFAETPNEEANRTH